jgi:tetratricopeptide (TPR) repeat protein
MKDESEVRRLRLERVRKFSNRDAYATTILLAKRFLQTYPETDIVWLWLGFSLMQVGEVTAAEDALLKALEYGRPNNAWVILGYLGRNRRHAGDFDRAEGWFRRLIDEFPLRACGYIYLGSLTGCRGELAQAEAVLRKGTLCTEGCIDEAWQLLGNVLAAQQKFLAAADCFQRALTIDPNYLLATKGLRDVLACLKIKRRLSS